jgi:pyruvate,water dikinase
MEAAPVEAAPLAGVAELWAGLWERARQVWVLHFMVVGMCYTAAEHLADVYEALTPGAAPSEALTLIQGSANELHQVEAELHALAQRARAWPAVSAALEQYAVAGLGGLAELEGGPAFIEAFEAFLDRHGHLGQAFDDLAQPAWADEPALLLAEVHKRCARAAEDPEERRLRLAAQAESLAEATRQRLGAGSDPEALARFEAALAVGRQSGPLTEGHNYWLDRKVHALTRRFAVRVGRRLAAAGVLADPTDIFQLHKDEVAEALEAPRDLQALVASRKAELAHWRTLTAPAVLGKPRDPAAPASRFGGRAAVQNQAGAVRGTAACAGVAQGPARVVRTQADFDRVLAGDILVCASSNPSWVPLFAIISGVVTDTGGVLAHAAVVAREFGVPAVVGTGTGTSLIRDGQTVRIDGGAGIVYLHG